MFALEPGRAGALLGALGRTLPRPRAVLLMSPHWMSPTLQVSATPRPQTVHDFGGFPRALYALQYPAIGAPEVAATLVALLAGQGITAVTEPNQGLDHGAWVPLMHLYPQAEVPVLQISQPLAPSPQALLELGRHLAPLREQGILIVGSGSMTHNLYEFRHGTAGETYAQGFADWIWHCVQQGDAGALLDYRRRAPAAVRAHPTDEHLLPLYFALGAAGEDWSRATRLGAGVSDGVLSMDSLVFGAQLELAADA
jgi:4,5-DOPA dioxygenase extradiol